MSKVALFDLDDTLTDRIASIRVFARHFAQRFAAKLTSDITLEAIHAALLAPDNAGYTPRHIWAESVARTLPWRKPFIRDISARAWEIFRLWQDDFPSCAIERKDAAVTLRALRESGYRLGLITNGGSSVQNAKINALNLRSLLEAVIISSEVGLAKPDPAIFALALDQLDDSSREAWFVGGHPVNDVLGAAVAGLTPVWLTTTFPWPVDTSPPVHIIHRLPDFLNLLP